MFKFKPEISKNFESAKIAYTGVKWAGKTLTFIFEILAFNCSFYLLDEIHADICCIWLPWLLLLQVLALSSGNMHLYVILKST